MSLALGLFRELTLADRPVLEPFLFRLQPQICEFSFSTLFIWNQPPGYRWQFYEDRLLIFSENQGALLLPQWDGVSAEKLLELSAACQAQGWPGNVFFVPPEFIGANPELSREFELQVDRDNADYLYRSAALADLAGRRFQRKRNLIHQFHHAYPDSRVEAFRAEHAQPCFDLADRWCRERTCQLLGYEHEFFALKRALHHFADLPLEGLILKVAGAICAFSIFSPLSSQTMIIHFEKADPAIKGAAQVINQETAKILRPRSAFLNREQDLGLAGLRRAKLSYHPEAVQLSYRLIRRKGKGPIS